MKKLTFIIIGLMAFSSVAFAGGRFFIVLYDVPILTGLEDVPELSYTYDTVGGKIARASAVTDVTPDIIYKAYGVSLRQFGWEYIGKHVYRREAQILSISHESLDKSWLFHFTLRPNQENSQK